MSDEINLVQTGGVLAFAAVVLGIVRKLEPTLKDVGASLLELRVIIAAMLERDRIRDERRKRESMAPATRRPQEHPIVDTRGVPIGEFEHVDETTNVTKLMDIEREKIRAKKTVRAPTRGTHHDGED